MRCWIAPDGSIVEVPTGVEHNTVAVELLAKHYPGWIWYTSQRRFVKWIGPSYALESRGWLRVVTACSFSLWSFEGPALSSLIELVTELPGEQRVHIETHCGEVRGTETTAADFLKGY